MFYQIILSPQVKRCAIITYKHSIHELPHELPKDLRLRKLGNIRNVSKPLPAKMKILLIVAKNSLKTEIKLFS